MSDHNKCLVLYDGVCHLCNWWVRFLIRVDTGDRLRFAALQNVSNDLIPKNIRALSNQTVLVYCDQHYETKSDAVLTILRNLPSPLQHFRFFRCIPRFLRDGIYSLVAKTRYQVFGQYEACPVIPAEWRHKFPKNEELSEILT